MYLAKTPLIILAGGFGTRLKSVFSGPKPLAPVNNYPFLGYLINHYSSLGFREIVLSTYYQSDSIKNFIQSEFPNKNISIIQEPKPLGTGGALKYICQLMNLKFFFATNGDTYIDINSNTLNLFKKTETAIVVTKVPNNDRYGEVIFDGSFNVKSFNEKENISRSTDIFINAGFYFFEKGIIESMPTQINFSIEKFFDEIVKSLKIKCIQHDGHFIDIGIPEDYLKASEIMIHEN